MTRNMNEENKEL